MAASTEQKSQEASGRPKEKDAHDKDLKSKSQTTPSVEPSAQDEQDEEISKEERKRLKKEKRAQRRLAEANNGDNGLDAQIASLEAELAATEDHDGRKTLKKQLRAIRKILEAARLDNTNEAAVEAGEAIPPQFGQSQVDAVMAETSKPHKKRRKVSFAEPTESNDEDDAQDEQEVAMEVQPSNESEPAASSSGFLPSFPRPQQPPAPSPAVLYRQGLDKSISQAEIVDSTTRLPLQIPADLDAVDSFGLTGHTRRRLGDLGISELFAVQTAVIPFLLTGPFASNVYLPYNPPRDICVSAPTGSGKTLAYALPIVETLSQRVVTRLRALVILPTRDLAIQVHETFISLAKGRGLDIVLVTGQQSFANEQRILVGDSEQRLKGGSSKVDILICTPGRLLDHLNGTSNFTLQHLRYLVIDEADRLITQTFQEWLPKVLKAIDPPPSLPQDLDRAPSSAALLSDAVAPHWSHLSGTRRSGIHTTWDEPRQSSCQKLLFSATLTQDPGQIASLNLRKPKYFIVKAVEDEASVTESKESFALPDTLSEHWLAMETSQKPLMLFYLIQHLSVTNALVFTRSTESTTRLVRLLEFFEVARTKDSMDVDESRPAIVARPFSSDLPPQQRRLLLQQFKEGKIHILICSDLVSRGIDLQNVMHVVNYDVPLDMRRYVHRVGRTARAGRQGDAWTLIENQEARHFKQMARSFDRWSKMKKVYVATDKLEALQPHYQTALAELKATYTHS